jgi:hypothetical protein
MEDKEWQSFVEELQNRGYTDENTKQIAWCAYNIGKIVGEYEEKSRVVLEKYRDRYAVYAERRRDE